jgi:hypothetical protein
MPYCNQCGNELKEGEQFCGACGARQGQKQSAVPATPPAPPPTNPTYVNQYPPQKSGGTSVWKTIVIGVLVIALIAVGVLYGMEISNLNKAKANIATLENNVSTLQIQLAAEQAHAASLQSQLTATISDLNAAQDDIKQLESDLAESELRVTNLQSSLNQATAELAQAYTEIAGLTNANTALTEELNTVKDPRHFNSLQELEIWLENDNTDTAYSSLSAQAKAYVLQVKALRDGFILSACIDWDSNFIYSWNVAIVGDTVYSVNAATDKITVGPDFGDALPLHPLPLS